MTAKITYHAEINEGIRNLKAQQEKHMRLSCQMVLGSGFNVVQVLMLDSDPSLKQC
jgi:hypothetical protein